MRGVLELTINRPKALNALDAEIFAQLAEILNPLVDKRPIAYSGLLLKVPATRLLWRELISRL